MVLDYYKNAHERYSILLSDRDTELTGLQKLKEYSIYRGDYEEYITYSDRLLQKYIQEDKRVSYVNELASRAFTLVFTFNKKKESNRIIEEIKSIFNGEEEDIQFDNLSLFRRIKLLDAYAHNDKGQFNQSSSVGKTVYHQFKIYRVQIHLNMNKFLSFLRPRC